MITKKSVKGKRIDFKLNGRRVFAQNGKNNGMTLPKSTGELLDNSNSAGADKIKLHFIHEKNENWSFVIEDNGISVLTDTRDVWASETLRFNERESRKVRFFSYKSKYPHAGAGVRVQF